MIKISTCRNILLLLSLLVIYSCVPKEPEYDYTIAFSQCTMDDSWREQMLMEMNRELSLVKDKKINFIVRNADGSNAKQQKDVDFFTDMGVDLLIVSPHESAPLVDHLNRTYQEDIPIIVIDRKINSDNYTTYISANNHALGMKVGNEVVRAIKEGHIVEIKGLEGSSPCMERASGFHDIISANRAFAISSLDGDWTEQSAIDLVNSNAELFDSCQAIFAHNDYMARGALMALKKLSKEIPIFGIDGLYGKNLGIDLVRKGHLMASFSYPTGGDKAIQVALQLLAGEQVARYIELPSITINHTNAEDIYTQATELYHQSLKLDHQIQVVDDLIIKIGTRERQLIKTIVFALLIIIVVTLYSIKWYVLGQRQKKDYASFLEKLDTEKRHGDAQPSLEPMRSIVSTEIIEGADWLKDVTCYIEENYMNPDLKVDNIATEFNMSNSTFYRKIKAVSGYSAIQIIQNVRLENAAVQLWGTNNKIDSIAFDVGFSDSKYFSKCFSKKYGKSPSVFRKSKV